jgi:hypothetical protein
VTDQAPTYPTVWRSRCRRRGTIQGSTPTTGSRPTTPPEGTTTSSARAQTGPQRQDRNRRPCLGPERSTRALRAGCRGAGQPARGGRVRRARFGEPAPAGFRRFSVPRTQQTQQRPQGHLPPMGRQAAARRSWTASVCCKPQGTPRSRPAYVADLVCTAAGRRVGLRVVLDLGRCGPGGSGRPPGSESDTSRSGITRSPGNGDRAAAQALGRVRVGGQARGLEVARDPAGPAIHTS